MLSKIPRPLDHLGGRRRVSTMMKRMGIHALYRKPSTSTRHPVYPYQLRDLTITRSNHVWAADITYIPMQREFVYLFAAIDWASCRVLSWSLSQTEIGGHGMDAVQEAINRYGTPAIFNTDQGGPVHQPGIHGPAEGLRYPDQHGWERLRAGQRVRGTALEEREIRGGVPVRLRVR